MDMELGGNFLQFSDKYFNGLSAFNAVQIFFVVKIEGEIFLFVLSS